MKKILMLSLCVGLLGIVGCEKKAGAVRLKDGGRIYYCSEIVDEGDFFRLKLVNTGRGFATGTIIEIPRSNILSIRVMSKEEVVKVGWEWENRLLREMGLNNPSS